MGEKRVIVSNLYKPELILHSAQSNNSRPLVVMTRPGGGAEERLR